MLEKSHTPVPPGLAPDKEGPRPGKPQCGNLVPRHSQPILVLTMRRSGGTNLARILFAVNDRPDFEDEAFNPDRSLGNIIRSYRTSKSTKQLRAAIRAKMALKYNLKHAIDTISSTLTRIVVEEARAHGYRLLVLLRRNERARLRSLAVGLTVGAWGPPSTRKSIAELQNATQKPAIDLAHVQKQIEKSRTALGALIFGLNALSAEYDTIFFEDLYGREEIGGHAEFWLKLGFVPEDLPEVRRLLASSEHESSAPLLRLLRNANDLEALCERLCV